MQRVRQRDLCALHAVADGGRHVQGGAREVALVDAQPVEAHTLPAELELLEVHPDRLNYR